MDRLLLHSIYNRDTNEEVLKEKSNRVCMLGFENDFTEMIIKFEKGGTLKHFEKVENVEETDYGVWVITTNKLWRFDNIESADDKVANIEEFERINKCKKEKVKLNLENQYYRGLPLRLIDRKDYNMRNAKRFIINNTNQNVWIPNVFLEKDGTIKNDVDIMFIFKKAKKQLELAGYKVI